MRCHSRLAIFFAFGVRFFFCVRRADLCLDGPCNLGKCTERNMMVTHVKCEQNGLRIFRKTLEYGIEFLGSFLKPRFIQSQFQVHTGPAGGSLSGV